MNHADIQAIAQEVAKEIKAAALFNKWFTMKEAMDYAKVSRSTLRRWIDAGEIYATKTTGDWRIDRESIDAYFNMERL